MAISLNSVISDWESDDEMVGLAGLFWSSRCRGNQLFRLLQPDGRGSAQICNCRVVLAVSYERSMNSAFGQL
jgi:hypothetical protein